MKILMIGDTDCVGGAAIGTKRLSQALIESGNEVCFYVNRKKGTDKFVHQLPFKKGWIIRKIIKKSVSISLKLIFKTSNRICHSIDFISFSNIEWINQSDFDVVHLHWINNAISIADIKKINKPIVWTMHDSWVCCGAEHHPNVLETDTRWKDGYYKTNKPNSTKGIDLCRYVWETKRRLWKNVNIKFIAPSKWEKKILVESALFKNGDCTVIPNILPYDIFYGRNVIKERVKRNIPLDKKILGFGAAYEIEDLKSMKGTYYLLKALEQLENMNDYFLVIFGPAKDAFTSKLSIPFYCSGYIEDENIMAEIYSCCDCYINSSLIENLGYTTYESLACGVPVVAFNVGGTSDLVIHKENGYLAEPYSSEDLANGIKYCLNHDEIRKSCKEIKKRFSKDDVVRTHLQVYQSAIDDYYRK